MSVSTSLIPCDRCGQQPVAEGGSRAPFSFCRSCGLFVCDRCWFKGSDRCRECVAPRTDSMGRSIRVSIRETLAPPSSETIALQRSRTSPAPDHGSPKHPEQSGAQAPSRALAVRRFLVQLALGMVSTCVIGVGVAAGLWAADMAAQKPSDLPQMSGPKPMARPSKQVAIPTAVAAPQDELYTVRVGDTLTGIADRYYGDPALWPILRDANADRITDVENLRIGTELRIPVPSSPP